MKRLLHILSILNLALYLSTSFCLVDGWNNWDRGLLNSGDEDATLIWTEASDFLSVPQFTKNLETKLAKSLAFSKLTLKITTKTSNDVLCKDYNVNNLLQYNLPRMCFNFPRSEHGDKG
ncbi:MAG: hypothetical protein ACOY90_00080 [Candidatus Zhuqueibacterota bacterium]